MSETQNTKVGIEQGGDRAFVKDGGELEIEAGGTFKASTIRVGDTVYTLPAVDGEAGQALVTDGAGTLSWAYVEDIAEEPGG